MRDGAKSALLCTGRLTDWAGSEIVTLELAEELRFQGFSVTVFTHTIDQERYQALQRIGVDQIFNNPDSIDIANFDIVYSQQNTLSRLITPASILKMSTVGAPFFVYAHLSPYIDMEAPLSRLEWCLANVVAANSEETRARLQEFGINPAAITVVPNPVPREHFVPRGMSGDRSVLIVSNHIPAELHQARSILTGDGWRVDILGKEGLQQKVSAEMLSRYSTIITIGKTVQMALAGNRPVYVYDHFGGPGWLSSSNFQRAAATNFSGRCTPAKKSAQQIAADIRTNDRPAAPAFRRARYSLQAWVSLLVQSAEKHGRTSIPQDRVQYLSELATLDRALATICVQAFDSFYFSRDLNSAVNIIHALKSEVSALKNTNGHNRGAELARNAPGSVLSPQ